MKVSGLRLLIVDDDRDFGDGLAEFLEVCGHHVDLTYTGEQAIAATQVHDYAAILIDIGLPVRNGVEVMRAIKRSKPNAVCLLLTGHSADAITRQGIKAGALEILTKPVDLDVLTRGLDELAQSRSSGSKNLFLKPS